MVKISPFLSNISSPLNVLHSEHTGIKLKTFTAYSEYTSLGRMCSVVFALFIVQYGHTLLYVWGLLLKCHDLKSFTNLHPDEYIPNKGCLILDNTLEGLSVPNFRLSIARS